MKRATNILKICGICGCNFNPRPREEGDFVTGLIVAFGGSISIHALVKRATQNTITTSVSGAISIHALVKRATLIECDGGKIWIISIHALVKRATGNF